MSDILSYLSTRFFSKAFEDKDYTDYKAIYALYKKQPRKYRASLFEFVEDLEVPYVILNTKDRVIDIAITNFHHKSHKLLLDMESLISNERIILVIDNAYKKDYELSLERKPSPTSGQSNSLTIK